MPVHTKLRRFTPAQQDWFQKNREARPVPLEAREDVPHIVFPSGARFVSDFDMTHAQMQAVSGLMFAGLKMREAVRAWNSVSPEGAWHQFFGNWDLLRLSNRED